jgi:hypothetical protein
VGQRVAQRHRAGALASEVVQRRAAEDLAVAAVDRAVGRELAAVERRGGGHDLERRARRVGALGRPVGLRGVLQRAAVRRVLDRLVRVVAGDRRHRQDPSGRRLHRHDRAGPAGESVDRRLLDVGLDRQVHVVAALVALDQPVDRRRQLDRLAAQPLVLRLLETGLAEVRVADPDRRHVVRALGVPPLVDRVAGRARLLAHAAGQHGAVRRDDLAARHPLGADQVAIVLRARAQRLVVEDGPPRRVGEQQREHADDDQVEVADRLVHAGRRASSETRIRIANRTKLAMIDDPP